MTDERIRVLCVDDHEVLLEGLISRLRHERNFDVVGRLESASGLIAEARRCRPDLVVLDIAMPGTDPFEAAADLHSQLPKVRTVILTAHLRDRYLDAAFHAGAWGYLYKGDSLDEIVAGLRRAAGGEYVISPGLLELLDRSGPRPRSADSKHRSKLDALTPREIQILELIGRGFSRDDIAETLHRSRKTIDTHRASLMRKLGIHNRTGLALYAVTEGLVDIESVQVSSKSESRRNG